jgi:hypothetical protein
MSAAGIVTIILIVVAVIVVALFLVRIGTLLREISSSLTAVISSVGLIPGRTAPLRPVLTSINHDLGVARDVLEDLLAKKLGGASEPARIAYARAIEQEFIVSPVLRYEPGGQGRPEPPAEEAEFEPPTEETAALVTPEQPSGGEPESDVIHYQRAAEPESEPAAIPEQPSGAEPESDVIHYRRAGDTGDDTPEPTAPAPESEPAPNPAIEMGPDVIRYRRGGQ